MENNILKKLNTFIKEKNLEFIDGTRNVDSVALSGYALYLGIENADELLDELEIFKEPNIRTLAELKRVFKYAKENNYGDYYKEK